MNTIKKVICAICILTCILSGCTVKDDQSLTITMMASAAPHIMGVLRDKFPDINFVPEKYAGSNTSSYQKEQLIRGQGGDLFFYTTFLDMQDAKKYLIDLSGYPFLANFDKGILSTLDIDGSIYQIPGPITVRYIVVNKTLFKKNGWKIPRNFDETVSVCKRIRKDRPDITPLGLGMAGMGYTFSVVTSYAQMGFLNTAEGQAAEKGFLDGTASFGDAFGEGLDMVGRLVDAGAFSPEKFEDYWDVSPRDLGDRKVAMAYIMGPRGDHADLISGQAKSNPDYGKFSGDKFVALPLYGANPKNKGLILGASNTWGISKYLEEKGNEKKLANALRVLEYVSSEEGQLAIRTNPAAIPALKNLKSKDVPVFMRKLWKDSTNSIKSFFLYTGYEHVIIDIAKVVAKAMSKKSAEGMKEKVVGLADKINSEFLKNQLVSSAHGYAEDDFSVEQTRKLSCDAFRVAANADLGIASEAGAKNGITNAIGLAGKLFKGDITNERLNVIVAGMGLNIVSVTMTGQEIHTMLEKGKILPGSNDSFTYWSAGVDVTRKDDAITSIQLNGKELEDNATYKVAMIKDDYSEEFAASHKITDSGVDITKALEKYFEARGRVSEE